MTTQKITLVYSEDHDWVGLYLDGKLATEGHSLNADQVLQQLGLKYQIKHMSNEWCEGHGRLPNKEEDCNEGLLP